MNTINSIVINSISESGIKMSLTYHFANAEVAHVCKTKLDKMIKKSKHKNNLTYVLTREDYIYDNADDFFKNVTFDFLI